MSDVVMLMSPLSRCRRVDPCGSPGVVPGQSELPFVVRCSFGTCQTCGHLRISSPRVLHVKPLSDAFPIARLRSAKSMGLPTAGLVLHHHGLEVRATQGRCDEAMNMGYGLASILLADHTVHTQTLTAQGFRDTAASGLTQHFMLEHRHMQEYIYNTTLPLSTCPEFRRTAHDGRL